MIERGADDDLAQSWRPNRNTYIDWYKRERVHSRIEDRTPEQAYWALLPELAVAAY